MIRLLPFLLLITLFAACAPRPATSPTPALPDRIETDTTWSGTIRIARPVTVAPQATLTILPGTDILFTRIDADRDGLGDNALIIEGGIIARGTEHQPIRFRSAEASPLPGDWLELRIDHSKNAVFRWVELNHSANGLHAHFTRLILEDSVLRQNIDGCRLGESHARFDHLLVEENLGKGLNFRNSDVAITGSIIRSNRSGIFVFETNRPHRIEGNNIVGNGDNLRLGDFFTGEVVTNANWWGSSDEETIGATIHDRRKDATIGVATLSPVDHWLTETGPRTSLKFRERWKLQTDGFIDAGPVATPQGILLLSWDGKIRMVDENGTLRWGGLLGDVVDAQPAVDNDSIYLQTWGRRILALRLADGTLRWERETAPSPQDDHRQGSPVLEEETLWIPLWNGTLLALDAKGGKTLSAIEAGAPLRSKPLLLDDRVIQGSGSGALFAFEKDGSPLWQLETSAPVLAAAVAIGEELIAVDRDGQIGRLTQEGSVVWMQSLGESVYYSDPVVSEKAIYLATANSGLYALDPADGSILWRADLGAPSYAPVLHHGGRLFVGTNDGELRAYDAATGRLLGSFTTGGAIQGRALIIGTTLYIGSRDGNLYSLDIGPDA